MPLGKDYVFHSLGAQTLNTRSRLDLVVKKVDDL
jgi:hypothetical protein